MIVFHEGLPGSGKSYEAMSSRIIPALTQGRAVVAYVEGLDFDKIAHLAKISVERCKELLTKLDRSQLQTIEHDERTGKVVRVDDHLPGLASDNALIVLDEAQNFWGNRARLGADMTQFITEHRHRGIDIILLGQDIRDVHATWRRRVELKLSFLNLNGFGRWFAKRYSCTTYRHLGGDEFKRVGMKVTSYDAAFFGTYKSHVSDETNTETYSDERGQVLSNPLLKFAVPAAVVAGLVGFWQLWVFFHPAQPAKAPQAGTSTAMPAASVPAGSSARLGQAQPLRPVLASAAPAELEERSAIERRLADLAGRGRIRLAGLVTMGDRTSGVVEWVTGSSSVAERLTLDALRTLGVAVLVSGDTVQIAVGKYSELATSWPLEEPGRASNAMVAAVRGPQAMQGAAPLPDGLGGSVSAGPVDLPGPMFRHPDPRPDTGAGTLQSRIAASVR